MYTYALLSLPFIGFVLLLDLVILKTGVVRYKQTWLIMAGLLLLTAVADQLLAGLPIVLYNPAHFLQIRLGYVPIEDFSYTIAAVIGIGALYTHGSKAAKTKRP